VKPAAFLIGLCALVLATGASSMASAQALAPGEVTLELPDGSTYIGTVTNGVPDGKGYFRDKDGTQYEGDVHMGRREGFAEALFVNGKRYKGQWKNGVPDGTGAMSYMAGGAYEGEWRDGERHGKGTMTFAGSGRRAEVHFTEGQRDDVASPEIPAASGYAKQPDAAPVGSHLQAKEMSTSLPLNVGYEKLTPAQKRYYNARYPALDEGDEPPYPLKGPQGLYEELRRLTGLYEVYDDLLMYVLVGADGKVMSVTTIGVDDPVARRQLGGAAGQIKYKPARCGGQPCQMAVIFNLHLRVQYRGSTT
jgi:hypothetical protein